MKKKACVIFNNFGPYHLSRIDSFDKSYRVGLFPIQLASSESLREWKVDNMPMQIITVQDNTLEESSASQVCGRLVSLLNQLKPGVVVVAGYSEPAMRTAAGWARKNGVHSILLSESNYVDRPRMWLKEKLKGHWIKKHFDAAFVGGAKSAEYLEGLGFPRNRIWRGYDVVDNDYFYRSSEKIKKNEKHLRTQLELPENYFLYVGRFSPEKNLIRLLEAYKRYCTESSSEPWNLVMVGSGPQEQELKSRAKELGLKSVKWCGFKQYYELPPYYALASCFILPSVSEPWGLVVNEAMACGLPVLVSEKCGCIPDLVFPGVNGHVFNPYDTVDIAYYMKLASSGEIDHREMGMASTRIVSNYTPQTWGRALADCIEVTINRPSHTEI